MSRLESITLEAWRARALAARGSVEALADSAGVTSRQLERFFNERWGMGPKRWAAEVLMQEAARLIAGGMPVKQVAWMLGYKEASHFSKMFKRYHGLSPSELRGIGCGLRSNNVGKTPEMSEKHPKLRLLSRERP